MALRRDMDDANAAIPHHRRDFDFLVGACGVVDYRT
jgi:hypothetical protein